MYFPDLNEFRKKAKQGNLIPVYKPILADLETPVSAFYKIGKSDYAFLLESVEGGEKAARYSFLGNQPSVIFQSKGNRVKIQVTKTGQITERECEDPFLELENLIKAYQPVEVEGLPRFHGGVVGYLGYDMVRFFEKLPDSTEDDLDLPDSCFMLTDTILVFDHVSHQIKVVANAHVEDDVDVAYETATSQIDELITKLKHPLKLEPKVAARNQQPTEVKSNFIKADYEKIIDLAKEYIGAGDIIQVVPSQRFSTPISVEVFEVYRALRMINPSPYMYYLKLGDNLKIAGASPEMMVRVEDGIVETCPIAGTKPRGQTPKEDEALARELIEDPKEIAEHVMLVDLGRNDLGRVCEYDTVHVSKMMAIERYSHVMHIVSQVEGKLRQGMSAFDVIRACFPAGTLSGAPKIRAMEIIDELELTRRGCYGGAVGYFSFDGNSDTAITIRTIIVKDGIAYVQAGGGIVTDSVNETEFQETVNKARTVIRAIELAELGLE